MDTHTKQRKQSIEEKLTKIRADEIPEWIQDLADGVSLLLFAGLVGFLYYFNVYQLLIK